MTNGHGYEEGETCGREGCAGIIMLAPPENCSCHIHPPCGACTAPRLYCPDCDWRESEDPLVTKAEGAIYMNTDVGIYVEKKKRVLDPSKIDYHTEGHSNSSQKCIGVCPLGTSSKDVQKACDGTFGGRFDEWHVGAKHISFEFIAYTD